MIKERDLLTEELLRDKKIPTGMIILTKDARLNALLHPPPPGTRRIGGEAAAGDDEDEDEGVAESPERDLGGDL